MNKKYVVLVNSFFRLPHVALCVVGFLSLFSFVLLSKYEDRPFIRNLDFAVTTKIQDKIDHMSQLRLQQVIDNTMEGATFFASPEFTVMITVLLTGLAFFGHSRNQRSSPVSPTGGDSGNGVGMRWRSLIILVAFVAIVIIELYAKSIVHHPSPPFSMIKHTTSVFPANYINEQFSYPSGHAARAVFLGILWYLVFSIQYPVSKNNKRKVLVVIGIIGYVLLVATSRIYLGHHWFSDVFGGLLLGGALGVLTWEIMATYNRETMSD